MVKTADVIVIGGGLAGLFNALLLRRAGFAVTLIERKTYPFHRVCGEYISNEVLPFLHELNIDVFALGAEPIHTLDVTSPGGKRITQALDLGGFGLSRFTLDAHMYELLRAENAELIPGTKVNAIRFCGDYSEVDIPGETLRATWVIGAFGKRSNLDQQLQRPFFSRRSPYMAVKYHVKTVLPAGRIQLHNFKNGYCGINKVDGDRYCLCYLVHRDELRTQGSIEKLEQNVLSRNPYLKQIFAQAEFLWPKPEVINEISFERKSPVEQHVFMSGDTAGMIAPLCGNGMAMAIHSARILASVIIKTGVKTAPSPAQRAAAEAQYTHLWNAAFARRLLIGRKLQHMFGRRWLTGIAVALLGAFRPLFRFFISKTHGKPMALSPAHHA